MRGERSGLLALTRTLSVTMRAFLKPSFLISWAAALREPMPIRAMPGEKKLEPLLGSMAWW